MNTFTLSPAVDANKVFLIQRSQLDARFDPEMILYQQSIQSFAFPVFPLKHFLKTKPQYGAGESGVLRVSNDIPRYVRITDIDEKGQLIDGLGVTAETIENQYLLRHNDLLIARSGNTVGKAYLHDVNKTPYTCIYAGYMIRFIVDEAKMLPEFVFLYTQLKPYQDWVKAIQRTAGQPNINAEEYKSLPIPCPTLVQQQKLTEIYKVASQISLNKQQQAAALLASIDGYLLGELGITLPQQDNRLEKRMFRVSSREVEYRLDPYYFQSHFIDFFEILAHRKYPIKSVKSLAKKITSGITPLSGGDAYTTEYEGIPFIRSGNINIDGNVDFSDLFYLKPDIHHGVMKSSKLLKNDLMIAIVGATIGQVGIYLDDREANINQAIALVRLQKDINPQYVKELIKSSIGQMCLNRLKRPVARAYINLEEISTLPIIVLPIEKQNEIVTHIQSIRTQAAQLQTEAAQVLADAKAQVERMILGEVSNE